MAKPLPNLNISNPFDNSYEELFSTEEQRQSDAQERIVQLRCDEIDQFTNHPFKVRDNQEMFELADSIRENGVMVPCVVRPKENGRYEMVSGHRRRHAALLAGIETIPAIVRNLSDEQATILMVDSNLRSREIILPSEKAFAYKAKMSAMKRQAGRPGKENVSPVGTNLRTDEMIAQETGDSRNQIHRYIRLTNLIPELLQMVDNSVEKPDNPEALQMALRPAVELSYLSEANQLLVLEFMESSFSTPSHAQAIQLRNMEKQGVLTANNIYELLSEAKPNQKPSQKISVDKFSRYFPPNSSADYIEKEIIKALDFYQKAHQRSEIHKSPTK
ncbi:MAG: ParB/RepB/Spo0J family partition protein [Candidatus Fimenecus sp.]